jgi:triacylglycerol esterase/lipase EstA (alpha/beta hydrolase family)
MMAGGMMVGVALLLAGTTLCAQTTASGTINAVLANKNGIALVFDSDPVGVALGAAGTAAATANFGNVSAFGPLSAGVTRPSVTVAKFTVRTKFDVQVIQGGLASANYTLTASLQGAPPIGFSFAIDAVTLTGVAQTIQANGAYNVDVPHNLDLIISTASPASGGPSVGTPASQTINFTATAN